MGKEHRHYHNPNDVFTTLPFSGYEALIRLLRSFADELEYHE
jgi:hypothetical protein